MHRIILAAAIAASITGCASSVDLVDMSRTSNLKPGTLQTSQFSLQTMVPAQGTYNHMRVYIEGDGHAWATSSQPSTDPTPHTSLMATLAAADRTPAAYLARPCQYLMSPNCSVATWTSDRFSSDVISSMSAGLDALKRKFGILSFELVGHSGGGAVALVLAGMRNDVVQVQTIAGNADPIYWTQLNKLTPLNKPVTPLQFSERLRVIPQRLYVGLNDTIVQPLVAQEYRSNLGGVCVEITSTNADHQNGYEAAWHSLANQPVKCK